MQKVILIFIFLPLFCQEYLWLKNRETDETIENSIEVPAHYKVYHDSKLSKWLYSLPLKPKGHSVMLFSGEKKNRQDVHFRVIDIDTGKRDLQQCADAVMRLRAEYLYSKKDYSSIAFNFTSGDRAYFSEWMKGYRPIIESNRVSWKLKTDPDSSYITFKKYMKTVFIYAGSWSLSRELKSKNIDKISSGDVFIRGGFPGHAVMVAATAKNSLGDRIFLLLQSYMPAQDIHILKNPYSSTPWYSVHDIKERGELVTPEWNFELTDLKEF